MVGYIELEEISINGNLLWGTNICLYYLVYHNLYAMSFICLLSAYIFENTR